MARIRNDVVGGYNAFVDAQKQWAFRTFAAAYPHEAHDHDPERFWWLFRLARPGVTRERMEEVLRKTEAQCPDAS